MKDRQRNFRILLVDDAPSILDSLRAALESQGYQVFVETTGEQAIRRAKFIVPDLILLAAVLPDVAGFDTCRKLKGSERTREIPVIFTTKLPTTEIKLRAFEVGGVDCVTKPFDTEEVLARIEINLQQRELTEQLEQDVTERTEELHAANKQLQRELSERKKAEEKLRASEAFLEKIVEHIPDMIFVKEAKTLRFVRFNKAGEQLLGHPREELLGKTDYDFFPEEEADFFTDKDRRVLALKELVDIPEETIRTRSNEERILHTKKIPILDEMGMPQYLLGISEDITERKKAEQSIRELSQAVEQSPVSIVITDIEGKIEFVNAKFTQVSGYSLDEALGQNPRILKSGETPADEYRQLWETISSGGVWQGEFHNCKKSGELFWEHATIAPIRDADNVITHYVAVKEDITERKKLEDQLRQSQKLEAVGQLAGGIAHDFNNMLGVIIGHAELARGKALQDHSLRENLEEILAAGFRSTEMTRQLLTFARKQPISPTVIDLNDTVSGMLKMFGRLIGENIELVWRPTAELWPVEMDSSQIYQILVNLCVNARDSITEKGKIVIETQKAEFDKAYCAEHEGYLPGEYVMLSVSDNGSGMDKQIVEKIFEPFFTTKGVSKGTGLGLAVVYGIVKQNAGFINIYSEPGYGSIFKIYLPRYKATAEEKPEESPERKSSRGHEIIMVVEDEALHLKVVRQMLESYGYRVLAASSPVEALKLAKNHDEIHLLLTDVVMPDMNGKELAEKITSLFPDIMCIFMSGYTDEIIVHQGVLEEGLHFIQKPFSKEKLATKMREVLDSKSEKD
jgi:PAS domain S-box-containing protein